VVHHDADVGGVEVGASTFAQVSAAGRRLGYEIPTLAETLAALPAEVWLDVELKEAGWEAAALTLVREARPTDRVAFTSFDATSVAALRSRDPGLRLGLLVGSPAPAHGLATHVGELVAAHRRAERAGATFLAPNWRFVSAGALRAIHLRDMRAWVWTVNDEALLRRLGADPRVEAVITDDPGLALAVRASSGAPR
jgi:glycerophosphoryl diester phosphodiesterase